MKTKKYLVVVFLLLWTIVSYAQIGINREIPNNRSILHLDGLGDNAGWTQTKNLNDVIVDVDGNVGIGTIAPTAKVHIESTTTPAFRLVDGHQSAKKVLVSDSNGAAKWGYPELSSFGTINYNYRNITNATTFTGGIFYTGLSHTFTEDGTYSISFVAKARANRRGVNGAVPTFSWAQLLPRQPSDFPAPSRDADVFKLWQAQLGSPAFPGEFELHRQPDVLTSNTLTAYWVFNQTLTIDKAKGLNTVYLYILISGLLTTDQVFVSWGSSNLANPIAGETSLETTGSFVKISDLK